MLRGARSPGRGDPSWVAAAAPSLHLSPHHFTPLNSCHCPPHPPAKQILQAAVCPERRRGYDGALSALASVTEVAISNDLQVAKVYVSLYR